MLKNKKAIIIDQIQGSPEWLETRKGKITSTLSYKIYNGGNFDARNQYLGLQSNYKSPSMMRGNIVESQIRDFVCGADNWQNHTVVDGIFLASLDGLSPDGETILEIKCPATKGSSIYVSALKNEIPKPHYIQMQHAMGVSGATKGIYAVGLADANNFLNMDSLITVEIDFDFSEWTKIQANGIVFEKNVEDGLFVEKAVSESLVIMDKPINDLTIFEKDGEIDKLIIFIKGEIDKTEVSKADFKSSDGQALIKKVAKDINKTMNLLDGAGKKKVSVIKDQAKIIDVWRKKYCDSLKGYRAEILQPMEDFIALESLIDETKANIGKLLIADNSEISLIQNNIRQLEEFVAVDFAEFKPKIDMAYNQAKNSLSDMLKLRTIEKEQAEQLAEQERQAEIEHQAGIKAEQMINERAEQESITPAIPPAQPRNETKEHQAKINNLIMEVFIESGLTPDIAKTLVIMIAKGELPNLHINYE